MTENNFVQTAGLDLTAPLVSVVVTCHNYASFVGQALESVARQDYPHWECLVVDDCSSDGSSEVVSQFIAREGSGRFRLLRQPRNLGQMQGFKTGLAETSGPFVAYLDADDWWLPDMLSTHVRVHLEGPFQASMSCSDLLQVDAQGQVVSMTGGLRHMLGIINPDWSLPEPRALWDQAGRFTLEQEPCPPVLVPPSQRGGLEYLWTTTSAMFFRRTALELVMPEDAAVIHLAADSYVAFFCHALGGSLLIPTVHGCYRRHGANNYASGLTSMFRLTGDVSTRLQVKMVFPYILDHLAAHADQLRHRLGPEAYHQLRQSFLLEEPPEEAASPEATERDGLSQAPAGLSPRGRLRLGTRRALGRLGWAQDQGPRLRRRYLARCRPQDRLVADAALAAWRALLPPEAGEEALPLFDPAYYLERNPDVAQAGLDPLAHYLRHGAWEHRNPHPLFHSRYYLSRYPDVARSGVNPLIHWLDHGQAEGRLPHPLFDPAWYARCLGQTFVSPLAALAHLWHGQGPVWADPHPLFNCRYYLEAGPAAGEYGRHPLLHYLERGWLEGRSPHPLFDDAYYRAGNLPEAHEDPVPLVDFLLRGKRERLRPSPLFDTGWYLDQHPAHRHTPLNPLEHYLTQAAPLNIRPHRFFQPTIYTDISSDHSGGSWDQLSHFRLNWLRQPSGNGGSRAKGRRRGRVALIANPHGYHIFLELRELMAQGLRQAGAEVITLGTDDEPPGPEWRTVIIGPHEFFYLPPGPRWLQWEGLGNAVLFNTESLHSNCLERVLPLLLAAPAVLDLDWHNTIRLRALGVKAHFLPPGWVEGVLAGVGESWDPGLKRVWLPPEVARVRDWRQQPWEERPLDVLFLGQIAPRRSRFFAANAALFGRLECFLHLAEPTLMFNGHEPQALDSGASLFLARRAKVMLHLHRESNLTYLPGHRLLLHGMAQGALVVTETCDTLPPLTAGRDYLQAPLAELPALLEELLTSPEGLARGAQMAARGGQTLRRDLDLLPRLRTLIDTEVL